MVGVTIMMRSRTRAGGMCDPLPRRVDVGCRAACCAGSSYILYMVAAAGRLCLASFMHATPAPALGPYFLCTNSPHRRRSSAMPPALLRAAASFSLT